MKGAFFLASRAAVPVVPLAIIGHERPPAAGMAVAAGKGRVTIRVGKPIPDGGKRFIL